MVAELPTELVEISKLSPYPDNPRQGDVGAIVESLQALGQYRPIIVNSRKDAATYMTVLAGNHTLRAAQFLGWTEIAATLVDVDDDTAARIVLVDNRTNDLASYDETALAELLLELQATDTGLAGTGYDGDALDNLMSDLETSLGDELGDTTVEDRDGDADSALMTRQECCDSLDIEAAIKHLEWLRGLRLSTGAMAEVLGAAHDGVWGGTDDE